MKSVVSVGELEFESEVLAAKGLVLVDFTAKWCAPCRALEPIVEHIASHGRVKVVRVDGDDAPLLSARYHVRAFPTLVVFDAGREVARHVGLTSMTRIESLLANARSEASSELGLP
jgi:thioredoxin 1